MTEIMRCVACGSFTLKVVCSCGGAARSMVPLKYSPVDKYAGYRRTVKEAERKSEGLL